jgi:hypothetical protein
VPWSFSPVVAHLMSVDQLDEILRELVERKPAQPAVRFECARQVGPGWQDHPRCPQRGLCPSHPPRAPPPANLDRRVASLRWRRSRGARKDRRVERINGEEPMASDELATDSRRSRHWISRRCSPTRRQPTRRQILGVPLYSVPDTVVLANTVCCVDKSPCVRRPASRRGPVDPSRYVGGPALP